MSKRHLAPESLMTKADNANKAARRALEDSDFDCASNRAYYAMFNAARAALLASGAPIDLEQVRTHKGLIGNFGNYLVKTGKVSKELAYSLSDAQRTRITADYDGDFVEPEYARLIVEQAETFVTAMRVQFMPANGDDDDTGPGY